MPALRPVSLGPGVTLHPSDSQLENVYEIHSPSTGYESNIPLENEIAGLDSILERGIKNSSTTTMDNAQNIDRTVFGEIPGDFSELFFNTT